MDKLDAVKKGQAQVGELIPIAREIRSRTELHFGKEEESVLRPLAEKASDAQLGKVVAAQEDEIGPWLKDHGWEGMFQS